MRKIVSILFCLLLLIFVVGCSSESNQNPAETNNENVTPIEESNVQVIDDNTVTGKAEGFGGEIIVTLKVENGVITSCIIEGPDETEGIGSNAVEILQKKIVEENTVEMDGISGATFSSDAILEAAQLAYNAITNK